MGRRNQCKISLYKEKSNALKEVPRGGEWKLPSLLALLSTMLHGLFILLKRNIDL